MTVKQFSHIVYVGGGTCSVVGSVAHLFDVPVAPYIFSVGAALLIFFQTRFAMSNRDASMRVQRLSRIGLMASLLLAVAAYLMFTASNLWVVAVLIYALITLFLSFRGE